MGFELITLVVIDTDCTGSYKSNYHTISTAPIPMGTLYIPISLPIVYKYLILWWARVAQ
jgi:hypothetical protein